jgi:CheY-like chemotaxis protein
MTAKINSVLFVDDDLMSNMHSKRIFEKGNLAEEILLADCGYEALALLKMRFENVKKFPEIIFLDIHMPRLSGWDVLDMFKELPLGEHNTKIIMLTSSAEEADRARALKHPEVSGYAMKPLTEEYITELAQNIFLNHP